MRNPKQIIYNINYLKIIKDAITNNDKNFFIENFKKLINTSSEKKFLVLGRARAGIYIAVKQSIKLKKNNLILLSPYTIPEVVDLVINAGGRPHFIDFKKESTFFDLNLLSEKMKLKPAAVIITHYSLNQQNYKNISEIIKENNSILIEDSALAISGKSENNDINTLSDFSVYSFSSFKLLNCLYGGGIMLNNNYDDELIREINSWPKLTIKDYLPQLFRTIFFDISMSKQIYSRFTIKYIKKTITKNYQNNFVENKLKFEKAIINSNYFTKPLNFVPRELDRKIDSYKSQRLHRIKIASIYCQNLHSISIVKNNLLPDMIKKSDNFTYLISCKDKNHKQQLRHKLIQNNFHVGDIFYNNCHQIKRFQSIEGESKNVDSLIDTIILLPTHYMVNEDYAQDLCNAIKKFY